MWTQRITIFISKAWHFKVRLESSNVYNGKPINQTTNQTNRKCYRKHLGSQMLFLDSLCPCDRSSFTFPHLENGNHNIYAANSGDERMGMKAVIKRLILPWCNVCCSLLCWSLVLPIHSIFFKHLQGWRSCIRHASWPHFIQLQCFPSKYLA